MIALAWAFFAPSMLGVHYDAARKVEGFWSCPKKMHLVGATGPEANQDALLIATFFPNKCLGTVVEIGANDGMAMMTSLEFSKRGWQTVLIEADPRVFARLKKNRPDATTLNAVVGREVQNVTWSSSTTRT